MYAAINHLHLNRPVAELRDGLETEAGPLLAGLPGFRAVHVVQEAEDHMAVILLWDDQKAAEHAAKTFGPTWFAQKIAPNLAGPQDRRVGEVVFSRTA
jgi:hypothetical protein